MNVKAGLGRFWREWLRPLAIVLVVIGSFRSAVADWNDVPTGSMKPTILEGDRIVVNKLAYDLKVPFTTTRLARWDAPERGDIVVLFSPRDGTRLVKRVVGVAGDRIAMRGDRLIVNGKLLDYEPLSPAELPGFRPTGPDRILATERLGDREHAVMVTPGVAADRSFGPIVVPPGDVFLMGDNRDESSDSRVFGPVPVDAVVGRATGVALSVDPQRHYLPRWRRFLRGLR